MNRRNILPKVAAKTADKVVYNSGRSKQHFLHLTKAQVQLNVVQPSDLLNTQSKSE